MKTKEEKSKCCGASKIVQGSAEGTHYYACQDCKKEFIPSTNKKQVPSKKRVKKYCIEHEAEGVKRIAIYECVLCTEGYCDDCHSMTMGECTQCPPPQIVPIRISLSDNKKKK